MKSRPIIFDAESVRAILAGRKTQTRRVVKPQPTGEPRPLIEWSRGIAAACHDHSPDPAKLAAHAERLKGRVFPFTTKGGSLASHPCPYGAPGDELWVRETIRLKERWNDGRWADAAMSVYCADDVPTVADAWPWKTETLSSIHCPIGLSRIALRVTDVRVERVQEITNTDAMAEGIPGTWGEWGANAPAWALSSIEEPGVEGPHLWDNRTSAENFALRWNSINKKRGFGWDLNPWVWVISFVRN